MHFTISVVFSLSSCSGATTGGWGIPVGLDPCPFPQLGYSAIFLLITSAYNHHQT